jgi:hypothetical protein
MLAQTSSSVAVKSTLSYFSVRATSQPFALSGTRHPPETPTGVYQLMHYQLRQPFDAGSTGRDNGAASPDLGRTYR